MSERNGARGALDLALMRWKKINKWIDRLLAAVTLFLILFIGSGLIDGLVFLEKGTGSIKYSSFDQLRDINPDTIAWIVIDGTHIDHPVVRSTDNFDYLDKGFDGEFYAGGTLFMDKGNKSLEDPYCIIHGHHMAAGAMFGDLDKFLDTDFFKKYGTGHLLTPGYDYDIEVIAAGVFDAYDSRVYKTGGTVSWDHVKERAVNLRGSDEPDHVLVLSTCVDDMTDNRTVVFCALTNRREHR